MASPKGTLTRFITGLTANLRFPYLFILTAALFVIDLFVPDAVPLFDEIFLALSTLLLASWKKRKNAGRNEESGHQD